ncbi:hypothetical protein F3J34_13890 [Klebsiella sp. Ap-873]|nr:hypothetical protein [Klebsiella sp. Ap-873]
MRLTVLDDDHGERIIPGSERITVYLDDKEIKHVFTADDIKGEVICAVTNERGRMIAEHGEVKRQTLTGIVRIERCPH